MQWVFFIDILITQHVNMSTELFFGIFGLKMWAVPSNAVFCRSCNGIYDGMSFKYFLFLFLMQPRASITIGIVFVFILCILSISASRSLYFDSFSVTLVDIFVYWGRYINKKAAFFIFAFQDDIRSACFYLTICVNWYVP